jgi:hypothetical protein
LQENACLKRMTPAPDAIDDAAIIQAFAGIPALLEPIQASVRFICSLANMIFLHAGRHDADGCRDWRRQRHHHGTARPFSDE